jgi:nucleoside-diphosphate-sugar epimerase
MKVFVAGATGAVGKPLLPLLLAKGYEVVGMTRSRDNAQVLRDAGVEPVIANGLDRTAVIEAVVRAKPDVIVHQMTGLARMSNLKKFDNEFELTNRLRTTGTDFLMEAARLAGTRRLIAQSYGSWNYERVGSAVKTEDDALDPTPPPTMRRTMAAIRHVEAKVVGADDLEGVALRYGNLYGPGTSVAPGGAIVETIRKRQFPIVGDGAGVWSFAHVADVASATVAAVERGAPGVYNVCDDEPAPVAVWLPELARAVGAKPPWHVPVWLGRLFIGEAGVSMMTRIRGASNAKAKRELGWEPQYASWRDGFRHGLANAPATATVPAPPIGDEHQHV